MPSLLLLSRLLPRRARGVVLLALLGGTLPIAGAYALLQRASAHGSTSIRGAVTSVADGDTLTVLGPTGKVRVRLLGIDAPESSKLRYGHAECGGTAAKEQLKRWVLTHPIVTVRTDPTQDAQDRYGRTLGYVASRGQSAQSVMLRAGLAKVYIFNAAHPFERAAHYETLAAQARSARRGVWKSCGGFSR